jgi:CheY-like chemotaxis protein
MAARILIVEDNPANLQLVEYLLNAFGHFTLAARDGRAGLQVAGEARPDLIICDLQMPVMDGYELVRRLKEDPLLRHIPVIAVTAFSMPGDRINVLSAGFEGYFSKPIEPEIFVGQIEAFLPAPLRSAGPRPHN